MGIFTKEEKLYINPKTGKPEWVTTKKGIIKARKPTGTLTKAVKEHERKQKELKRSVSKQKWAKRKKTCKRTAVSINKALDWIEGKPPKKQKQHVKPRKKQYVIRNGMAYPVYKQKQGKSTPKTSKKPTKKSNDLFDMKIHW